MITESVVNANTNDWIYLKGISLLFGHDVFQHKEFKSILKHVCKESITFIDTDLIKEDEDEDMSTVRRKNNRSRHKRRGRRGGKKKRMQKVQKTVCDD